MKTRPWPTIFHSPASNKAAFQTDGTEISFSGPHPEEKIVQPPLDMVQHPLLDWGIFPEEGDSLINDYQFASWAVDRLEEFGSAQRENPFFLAVGFWLPHVPLYTSQKWFDLYPDEDQIVLHPVPEAERDDVPDFAWKIHWHLPEPRLCWLLEHDEWRPKVRAYLATINYINSQVGRMLDALDAQGLEEDTIVVLLSDHGYHLGEKGITGKNTLWERSTSVPLIFAGREAVFSEDYNHDIADVHNLTESLEHRVVLKNPWKLIIPKEVGQPQTMNSGGGGQYIDMIEEPELYHIVNDPHEQ